MSPGGLDRRGDRGRAFNGQCAAAAARLAAGAHRPHTRICYGTRWAGGIDIAMTLRQSTVMQVVWHGCTRTSCLASTSRTCRSSRRGVGVVTAASAGAMRMSLRPTNTRPRVHAPPASPLPRAAAGRGVCRVLVSRGRADVCSEVNHILLDSFSSAPPQFPRPEWDIPIDQKLVCYTSP